ncbi:hypothetical protein E4665_15765 [Sporolactobacillus shoreae]|uniref:Uncharacterized protein n=1 Tax=Sporolactobacillus shoreae TaxID=1465501 RepID=A0A4Z0GIL0_9BACL|nr:hypothetical protein [Sporolactobacillus shoreae]TGA96411.1 hypothetical protein E4665_15765 [Sporolactobacillus shoreae]
MNKKRWILTSIFGIVISAIILIPFIINWYHEQQAISKANDQFDVAFSNVIGTALNTGIEADNLGHNYESIIMYSGANGSDLSSLIDQEQTRLLTQGKTLKLNDYNMKMDIAYTSLMKLSLKNIKQGKEKKAAAKKFYDTVSQFYYFVNNPKPNNTYALTFQTYQKQYLNESKACTKLQ